MTPINSQAKYVKRAVAVILVIILLFFVLTLQHAAGFHLVSTTPSLDTVATVTPSIELDFNRTLNPKSFEASTNGSLITSSAVSGKAVTLSLTTPTDAKQNYAIDYTVSDNNGKTIHQQLSFKPSVISFTDLPKDQQQAILKQQTAHPASIVNTVYSGTEAIVNAGVTSQQLQTMEQDFYAFATASKQKLATVAINEASVQAAPHDPNSSSTMFALTFTVTLNTTSYNAQLQYSGLTTAELFLYDQATSNQVYDSGISDND